MAASYSQQLLFRDIKPFVIETKHEACFTKVCSPYSKKLSYTQSYHSCIQPFILHCVGEELSIPHSGVAVILVVTGVTDIAGKLIYGHIFDIKLARSRKHFFLAISGLVSGKIYTF